MKTIRIFAEVPNDNCNGCRFLKSSYMETHNYCDKRYWCSLFNWKIENFKKLDICKSHEVDNE
jgi:hypothetical protein